MTAKRIGTTKTTEKYHQTLGKKKYELSNHLGNILTTISDNKHRDGAAYVAKIISAQDYLSYGLPMPDRSFQPEACDYSFNGKKDIDFAEWQDYGFRNFDKRQRRFTSIDPLTGKFAMLTPFQYASNSPILLIDIDGKEGGKHEMDALSGRNDPGFKNDETNRKIYENAQQTTTLSGAWFALQQVFAPAGWADDANTVREGVATGSKLMVGAGLLGFLPWGDFVKQGYLLAKKGTLFLPEVTILAKRSIWDKISAFFSRKVTKNQNKDSNFGTEDYKNMLEEAGEGVPVNVGKKRPSNETLAELAPMFGSEIEGFEVALMYKKSKKGKGDYYLIKGNNNATVDIGACPADEGFIWIAHTHPVLRYAGRNETEKTAYWSPSPGDYRLLEKRSSVQKSSLIIPDASTGNNKPFLFYSNGTTKD